MSLKPKQLVEATDTAIELLRREPRALTQRVLERLAQHTRLRTLSPKQSTVGRVWRSRKPIWTTNLVLEMFSPRSLDAIEELRGEQRSRLH
jgi:hypothetical protein